MKTPWTLFNLCGAIFGVAWAYKSGSGAMSAGWLITWFSWVIYNFGWYLLTYLQNESYGYNPKFNLSFGVTAILSSGLLAFIADMLFKYWGFDSQLLIYVTLLVPALFLSNSLGIILAFFVDINEL